MVGGMIPEKVFQQILILGDAWEVFATDYDENQRKVFIRVRETPRLWPAAHCPKCNAQSVAGYDHVPERQWRHLNVCQLESAIVCALPRGRCRECQAVFKSSRRGKVAASTSPRSLRALPCCWPAKCQ